MTLALAAHAKLNLGLKVAGRRADGLHEVSTVLQAISLHDLLLVAPAPTTTLAVAGAAPTGEENLVLRAAAAMSKAAGRPLPAAFRLIKRIPAGAGLAGGSSDAAAALRALQRLHGLDVDLHDVAAGLGADVAFFIRGGLAVATGSGADLRQAPAVRGWFAIAWPGFEVSTAAVYEAWDRTGGEGPNELQAAAIEVEPRLGEFVARLGPAWRMTGSGSAFFLPADTRAQAEAAVAGLDCWTTVATPVAAWG